MQPGRILVVAQNRNLKRRITRALASAGFQVRHCPPDRDLVLGEISLEPQMCILDVDHGIEEICELLDAMEASRPDTSCLLVSQDHEMPFLRERLASKNLNNLIAKHGAVAASSEIIDENELIVTCQKLYRRDIFGLDKYMTTWGIKIHEEEVDGTASKHRIVGKVEEFLGRLDCYGTVKNAVLLVADELLMNAIFNAPRDAAGQPKYATWERSRAFMLEPHEHATFRYACDGRNIALSVTDRFGSLERDVIIKYLERCFTGVPAEVEQKQGGSGLGLYMVFNSITQLIFNIQAGVATEVIALFYTRSGSLAFKSSGRSLHIFYLK